MTKVLFIHGLSGSPRGDKALALQGAGFHVVRPCEGELPYLDMDRVQRLCQDAVIAQSPDVIVGSSLGGAVALRLETTAALVLMSPAVAVAPKILGPVRAIVGSATSYIRGPWNIPPQAIVIHAQQDEIVPFETVDAVMKTALSSAPADDFHMIKVIEKALAAAGYQPRHGRLIEAGYDHRLNKAAPGAPANLHPHQAMVAAVKILTSPPRYSPTQLAPD